MEPKHAPSPSVEETVSPSPGVATLERDLHLHDPVRSSATPEVGLPSLRRSAERILELASLPRDWDSEGAEPPTGIAIAAAAVLMTAVQDRHAWDHSGRVAPAFSAPIPDGGLQVEWEGSDARIDVQVNPDGSYGYLVVRGSGRDAEYQEADETSLEFVLDLIADVVTS